MLNSETHYSAFSFILGVVSSIILHIFSTNYKSKLSEYNAIKKYLKKTKLNFFPVTVSTRFNLIMAFFVVENYNVILYCNQHYGKFDKNKY